MSMHPETMEAAIEVMRAAMRATQEGRATVFVEFSGHVEALSVRVQSPQYTGNPLQTERIATSDLVYMDQESVLSRGATRRLRRIAAALDALVVASPQAAA